MRALLLELFTKDLKFTALNFECKSKLMVNQKYLKALMLLLKFG